MRTIGSWARVVMALGRRPRLWLTALRQWRALTPPQWWRRFPYLPLADHRYLAFRRVTQYGDPTASVTATDVIRYLTWCRQMRSDRTRTDQMSSDVGRAS